MRIVIVGASGNIGTAVLQRAEAEGGHTLVGVARRPPAEGTVYRSLTWHAVDVTAADATDRLTEAFAGADAVVNLVWGFQPGRDFRYLERVGVGGLAAVLSAVRRVGVPHLVHMSSVGAYASGPYRRVDESWPTTGIASSAYSRHKAAAERLLDQDEATGDGPSITRLRPGIVMQRAAGSSLLRYGLPGWAPSWIFDLVVAVPLPGDFSIPAVHASDVASAVLEAVRRRATGAFNLSAADQLTARDITGAFHAVRVPVPGAALRAVVAAGWALRLHRLDPGWIDLALQVPALDTGRARRELGWVPTWTAAGALRDLLVGMRSRSSTPSPVLRPRTVTGELRDALADGPITQRREA